VLDEPTTGLDRSARRFVWDAIRAHADRGGTVVLTTHYLEEADALARRIVLIEAGRIIADGGIAEIKGAAGLTRVSYRGCDDKLVQIDARDGGPVVQDLTRRGVPLVDLEVRPLSLEEALAAREAPR
jgi:ABC-2 type transport system ATP-binding protein